MMKLRTVIMSALILAFIAMLSTQAGALSYTTTLTDPGPGAGITYNLGYSLVSGTTYSATFTIQTTADTSPEWYAGYFLFKLDGSTPSDITNLSSPSGTGPWSVWDGDTNNTVKVLGSGGNYNQSLQGGYSGFYVTSLAGLSPDITDGIDLTGGTSTYAFTFWFTVPDGQVPTISGMPFRVGYYDGLNGNGTYVFDRLSRNLAPEPGTLLLLGSGLLGGGFVRRRLRKRG